MQISDVKAREILDSRGRPTLEVDVYLRSGVMGRAAVPSGASTGAHEAIELRDKDAKRYMGLGVMKALENVRGLTKDVVAANPNSLDDLDQLLIDKDGTENKGKLGANAILGISLAAAKALAIESKQWLYQTVANRQDFKLPVPLMNVMNGGAHANNGLDVQEFMIIPVCGGRYSESLRAGVEIFQALRKQLDKAGFSTAVGDEGGFAPKLGNNTQALEMLMKAIESTGYVPGKDIFLGLDVAATELFKGGKYQWEGKQIEPTELFEVYKGWAKKFPLVSIEDGFSEDDWKSWQMMTKEVGANLQIVGDDLFVTNVKRIKQGVETKAANALLVKVNQIGSLLETRQAVEFAQAHGFETVMSHRSGETEDATIADLAVAFGCSQIKTGAPCRGERTAKYNQLLRIEENLGSKAKYWGAELFG